MPLLGIAYGLLLFTLWQNRFYPGLALAFVGIASNALVIMVERRADAGLDARLRCRRPAGVAGLGAAHRAPGPDIGAEFLIRLGPLADIIPIPVPGRSSNVASIGDIFLTAGLGFFLFATLLRTPEETQRAVDEAKTGRYLGFAGTAAPARGGHDARRGRDRDPPRHGPDAGTRRRDRARTSADDGCGRHGPRLARAGAAAPRRRSSRGRGDPRGARAARRGIAGHRRSPRGRGTARGAGAIAIPRERAPLLERLRAHPYVRLALNPSFSALWAGQVISLFGDRVNQIALAAFVYEVDGLAARGGPDVLRRHGAEPDPVPPIAGTFVDRWDQKQVLVVSDILRAAAVLLVPVAVLINVWLAYPIIFLITTISIFFRPARQAILPRIVPEEDLLPANSAMWVGETLADVINYPIAGLFVVFLQSSLAIAFWFDAVTYLASAALLATIVVPPLASAAPRRRQGGRGRRRGARGAERRAPSRRSSRTSRPAGRSCATRRSCWRTRSRARPASSRWASSRSPA